MDAQGINTDQTLKDIQDFKTFDKSWGSLCTKLVGRNLEKPTEVHKARDDMYWKARGIEKRLLNVDPKFLEENGLFLIERPFMGNVIKKIHR